MIALYLNELTTLETELANLTALLEQKKQLAKELKAKQRKTAKLIDNLKTLIEELPGDAITNLRDSILSLFPSPQLPTTDSSGNDSPVLNPGQQVIWTRGDGKVQVGTVAEVTPSGVVIDEGHAYKPWIEKEFLTPATNDQPQTAVIEEQPEQLKSDILIATSPAELQNAFSQIPPIVPVTAASVTELKVEEQPEVENAITTAEAKSETPATVINEFCSSFVSLNSTVGYIRANRCQMAGEIMSAYLGCASQKLAKDWEECLKLWGAPQTEVRKPQRLTDAKWEVKIWGLPFAKLTRLAEFHKSFGEPVPGAKHSIEEAKKPELSTPNLNAISEDSSDMNSKSESEKAAKDAEIVFAGELAKEELGLAEAPLNDTPMEGDFVRIVSGHYAGLSGEATVASRRGGIIATEHGNRWVSWNDCEVTQKPLVN